MYTAKVFNLIELQLYVGHLAPKHGKRSVRRQVRTFVDLLEADTGVPRDCLPAAMDARVGWRIRAGEGRGGGGGVVD